MNQYCLEDLSGFYIIFQNDLKMFQQSQLVKLSLFCGIKGSDCNATEIYLLFQQTSREKF